MPLQTFEDLDVWKKACRLAVDIYKSTRNSKDFDLNNQMQRAAISISSNIAEGAERDSKKEFIRFLRISKASSAELRTQLYIAQKIRTELKEPEFPSANELIQETKKISAMLQALINSLQKPNN